MSHVALHPVRRSDRSELIEANIASREYHAGWVEPFTNADGFETWFGRILTGPNLSLVARYKHSGGIVGVFDIGQIELGSFRSAYVGYYGTLAYSRRGLMTEALGLATAYAFDELGLHRLEANIQPANAASIALARRSGFKHEGVSPRYLKIGGQWCDHERWTLLADEPRP